MSNTKGYLLILEGEADIPYKSLPKLCRDIRASKSQYYHIYRKLRKHRYCEFNGYFIHSKKIEIKNQIIIVN